MTQFIVDHNYRMNIFNVLLGFTKKTNMALVCGIAEMYLRIKVLQRIDLIRYFFGVT